ncbi:MAG: Ig-like domain-containing protein [bacterium]|jgi:hypothetical protein
MNRILPGKLTAAALVLAVTAALFTGIPAGASATAFESWLVNPGAERGTMRGWETDNGVRAVEQYNQSGRTIGPRSGDYFFSLAAVADEMTFFEQTIALAEPESDVYWAGGWIQTQARSPLSPANTNVGDYGEFVLTFHAADGEEIDSYTSGPISNPAAGSGADGYAEFSLDGTIPAGAAFVTYRLEGYRVEGDAINVFFDDLYFTVGNTAPEADRVHVTTQKNTRVEITLSATDMDDDELTYEIVREPENGILSPVDGNKVIYTPNEGFSGNDAFTFRAHDGYSYSNIAAVRVEILASSRAPIAYDAEWTVDAGRTNRMRLQAKDPNGAALTYHIKSGPDHGNLELVNGNEVRYTPDAGYHGADSFTFLVSNGTARSNSATVSINVRAAGEAADTVVWLPPVITSGCHLNGNRSLPVKFKLKSAGGDVAAYNEDVELTLYRLGERTTRKAKIHTWPAGDLKYNAARGGYSFVLHGKNYNLAAGKYALVVSAGDNDELGRFEFAIAAKAKGNNSKGNKGKSANGWSKCSPAAKRNNGKGKSK